MRIIAGGMFTIAGAIMLCTNVALTHAYGSAGMGMLQAIGLVWVIAGAVLAILGINEPKTV
jgi:hypothetical protein